MREIGIRQGRLSPAPAGRTQHFPSRSWKDEFVRARTCGFETVEWLFAAHDYEHNPIWVDAGQDEIREQIAGTGIQVRSLCADYFMAHPFFRVSEDARRQSVAVLNRLIVVSARVGVRIIVAAGARGERIRTPAEMAQLLESLNEPLAVAAAHGVRLGLETELPGPEFRALVERRRHPALGVCYDTGNAAAKGYDVAADVRVLAPYLCEVHIKDRKRNGPSVRLGQGDADFADILQSRLRSGLHGRPDPGNARRRRTGRTAAAQLAFLESGSTMKVLVAGVGSVGTASHQEPQSPSRVGSRNHRLSGSRSSRRCSPRRLEIETGSSVEEKYGASHVRAPGSGAGAAAARGLRLQPERVITWPCAARRPGRAVTCWSRNPCPTRTTGLTS